MSKRSEKIWAVIWILIFILTLILIYLSLFEKDAVKSAFDWLKNMVELIWPWNYLVVFFASTIESFPVLWALVPWQNIMFISWGFYSNVDFFGITTMAIVWAILGNYIGYLLWVYYWPSVLEKYWDYIWVWKTEYEYLKKWMHKYWFIAILFSKFHPTFRAIIPFIAGTSKMKAKNFIIFNVIGSAIWGVTIILIWRLFVDNYETIISHFWKIMTAILIAVIAYIFFFKKEEFKKYLKAKQEEINERTNQRN